MNYRRILLLVDLGADVDVALAALSMVRRVAPAAERLVVLAWLPPRKFVGLFDETPSGAGQAASATLDALLAAATGAASRIEATLATGLAVETLDAAAASHGIDLLVSGSLPLGGLPAIAGLRKRRAVAVLHVPRAASIDAARPLGSLVCVGLGRRSRASIAAFLRDHADSAQQVTVLMFGVPVPHDPVAALHVDGIRADVTFAAPQEASPTQWLDERVRADAVDLLVFARLPSALLLGARWPVPALLLPPPAAVVAVTKQRGLDAPDLVDDGGTLRMRFEHALDLGRRAPIADQPLALVSGGRVVAVVESRDGRAELPAHCRAGAYGIYRTGVAADSPPSAAIEQRVVVIPPGVAPLALFDAGLDDEELSALGVQAAQGRCELLAVRLRPVRSFGSIRERLRAHGLEPRVVDACMVLDEGAALDVPDTVDGVRLARVAARLRAAGFPVAAIVHRSDEAPATIGFVALRVGAFAVDRLTPPARRSSPASLSDRLEATTGAPLLAGNHIEVELDNATARRWLLEAIERSTQRVHLQVYMAEDDALGRRIEAALAAAAARGVAVRVLADSLHGRHGSLGTRNPLLERLAARPGIALRVSRPITGMPTLEDLKQRDHRKLVVVDSRLALVGGRNLSREYYSGFDEVALGPASPWDEVPWLDAGARVRGPAVTVLEHGFLEAWSGAGGECFDVSPAAPAGDSRARVVTHHGLRDAYTLEAYLALIETARTRLSVVNGFPLVLEIQHALLRALRRGVQVRVLFGHLAPMHDGEPFGGPWSTARVAATWLVHSRVDALIAAGADGYRFAVPQQPAWADGLGTVCSHVHAKLMSADGQACALGSANMDITGGYWESELLLVVEDAAIVAAVERRIDALLDHAVRVDRDDPQWRQAASRREWMRHWPGMLAV
ncbi:MAG: phosphatidylserine/phosphatidylglycerophosphate/cardiolipin synthase family protein [Burkholderiaceae bacterium]|nr:phosphatidylserine/phosphatidylglycerophosphate/cardiolipin synthase family protein [Burkholderiaceae bacterium]